MSAVQAVATMAVLVLRAADDADVSPGVIGFLVVALLGVATWLLLRSMTRQLKKIDLPDEHEPDENREQSGSADG
jgi:hypothetical protein